MSVAVLRGRVTDARRRKDRILEDLRNKERSFWRYIKNDRQNDRL